MGMELISITGFFFTGEGISNVLDSHSEYLG